MEITNPYLTSFLIAPYNRESLSQVLVGMRLSDISGMTLETFLSAVNQKDRLVATRLWNTVLTPLYFEWNRWDATAQYRRDLIAQRNELMEHITAAQRVLTEDIPGPETPHE